MSNDKRYIVCELLSSRYENQRCLNFISALVFATFITYLLFLIKTDKKNLLVWIDFLTVSPLKSYSKRHNLKLECVKNLFFTYDFFKFYSMAAVASYLFVVYTYYIESFLISLEKRIGTSIFIFVFLPTAFTSVLSMSWFYLIAGKILALFTIFVIFQSKKLDKLSNDLITYRYQFKNNNNKFISDHLIKFNDFLIKFKRSQIYFNFSIHFLGPLFLTLVFYPYAILVSNGFSVKFLAVAYSLNFLFVLIPLFYVSSIFKHSIWIFLKFIKI